MTCCRGGSVTRPSWQTPYAAAGVEVFAWVVFYLLDGLPIGPNMLLFPIRSRYVQGTKNHV